jgi:ATP-dependent DNA helicase RecQ
VPASDRAARKRRAAALDALSADVTQLDGDTEALFERLRARRKELADQQGVPPYVIFHDKTLAAMAVHRPATRAAMLRISGVGEAKLERYGKAFLEVINQGNGPLTEERGMN